MLYVFFRLINQHVDVYTQSSLGMFCFIVMMSYTVLSTHLVHCHSVGCKNATFYISIHTLTFVISYSFLHNLYLSICHILLLIITVRLS